MVLSIPMLAELECQGSAAKSHGSESASEDQMGPLRNPVCDMCVAM